MKGRKKEKKRSERSEINCEDSVITTLKGHGDERRGCVAKAEIIKAENKQENASMIKTAK
ncbi:hypothetical protein E2C01_084829 [Portunus trituberculatus]|uniref:Uncharacterized protein n=1 Tax=Portunus trituberculatus TaxID=210409 RepID=A0A5B7J8S9_PORTR|nr:hypothetical protein [Portunus trituberculatus]